MSCPSCFDIMFKGAKFCSSCGAKVSRTDLSEEVPCACPRCRVVMKPIAIGHTSLRECSKCEGSWVDNDMLQRICADRERQAAVLGMAHVVTDLGNRPIEKVRYLPCPVCLQLMHRVNFAKCSHVIIDVCKQHGTWLDKDELRRIVEFIQAGGMDKVREMDIARLERERRELNAAYATKGSMWSERTPGDYEGRGTAIDGVAGAIVDFLLGK